MRGCMRMKLNKYILLGLALIIPAVANAESEIKPYLSLRGGWLKASNFANKLSIEHENGFNVRAAIGVNKEYFDYELEGVYTNNGHKSMNINDRKSFYYMVKDGTTSSYSGFLNFYFNTDLYKEIMQSYFGGGLGLTKVFLKGYRGYFGTPTLINIENTKLNVEPSYQLVAGMKFNAEHNFNVLLDYRYFSTFRNLKDKRVRNLYKKFSHSSINIGVRFVF